MEGSPRWSYQVKNGAYQKENDSLFVFNLNKLRPQIWVLQAIYTSLFLLKLALCDDHSIFTLHILFD